MNLMRAVLVLVPILSFSSTVKGEEWTKREWEPVDRKGVANLSRRRMKGSKSGKSDKSGKSNKKYSKKEKGFLDEDITNDFSDLFEGYFLHHGSMSMNQAQPKPTPKKLTRLEFTTARHSPTPSDNDLRISFAQYSLTFSLMDSVKPTGRNDYLELQATTKSTFTDFMVRSYVSNNISYLKDFEVEFVRTGVSGLDEIFVVFQSAAIFDSTFPGEPSKAQSTLSDGLAQDQTLWMEYITALQELDPDNAFSSTIRIAYTESIPDEKLSGHSTMSTADMIAYSAAACITLLSVAAFIAKRNNNRAEFDGSYSFEKTTGSKSNESCQSTVAETLTCASSSVYGEPSHLDFVKEDEEVGPMSRLYAHESYSIHENKSFHDQTSPPLDSESDDDSSHEILSERIRGIGSETVDNFKDRSIDYVKEVLNYSAEHDSVEGNRHHDKLNSGNTQWYSLQERQPKTLNLQNPLTSKAAAQENDDDENSIETEQISEDDRTSSIGRNTPQDQSAEEEKIVMAQEYLQALLQNDEISQNDEDYSQEMLQAELESIVAEEAARAADEERLKEERRIAEVMP